ncbi:MAG: M20 family metallopeptidase [Patescibacteria group bacterium]|nr:M20 family metallopeptidase [Patescibacteria group bacterium]
MQNQRNKKILDLTRRLIRISSTKEKPDALHRVLNLAKKELPNYSYQEFSRKDQKGELIPSILFFNKQNRPDKFRILLHGHLDVVLAQDKKQFIPFLKGSRLYGRGALDMKSGAAILISVFKDLAKELPYPIGLSLTTDEEIGGLNGAKYQVERGVKADFVISGEPTNLKIGNRHKGLLTLELSANTQGGHTAYDGEDKNALFQVLRVQLLAAQMYPGPDGIWRTTCSPTIITTTNRANNIVPADAMGRLSIRWIPQDDPNMIQNNIAKIDKRVLVKRFSFGEAHFTSSRHPDVILLSKTVKLVTKKPALFFALPHGSDVQHWTNADAGGVDFGICGAGLHAEHEYAEIESFRQYADILEAFLRSIHL